MLEISSTWLETFVDVSVKSLLVALVAGLALVVLRVRDTNVRHRVWTGVLAGMLAMPLLVVLTRNVAPTVPLPGWMTVAWQVPAPTPESVTTVQVVPSLEETAAYEVETVGGTFQSDEAMFADEIDGPHDFARAADVAPHAPLPEENAAAVETARVAAEPPHDEPPLASAMPPWLATHWPVLLASTYVAIAAALLCRLAVGLVLTYRLVRGSRSVDPYASSSFEGGPNVRLLEHPQVFVPLTVGFFRPVILLPAAWRDWSREKLHAVLAHELAHVRRADWLVALVAELNRALYWFHPLAWFLRRHLAALAEQNCDDAVLEAHGDRAQYARYLLEVAAALAASGRRASAPLSSTAMARIPSVETRIDAILDPGRPLARKLGAIGIATLLAIGIPAVILAAALQPASEEEHSEPPAATEADEAATETESLPKTTTENESAEPNEDDSIRHITGRVVGPDGEPAPGANVSITAVFLGGLPGYPQYAHRVLAETVSDAEGRYELEFSVDFSDKSELKSQFALEYRDWRRPPDGWHVVAHADRFGPGWLRAEEFHDGRSPALQLTKDAPIEGRIVNLEGQPLSGVSVRLRELQASPGEEAILEWIKEAGEKELPETLQDYLFNRSEDRYPRFFPRVTNDGGLVMGSPALPAEVTTDEEGRFEFRGVGANRLTIVEVEGPNIAKTLLHVVTREMEPVSTRKLIAIGVHTPVHYGRKFEFVAQPSQPIEGRVTDAESGKPIAGMLVQVQRFAENLFAQDGFLTTRTDEEGRYRLAGAPQGGGHVVCVKPGIDQRYFETELDLPAATSFEPIVCDFSLPRGLWIRGTVTDKDSGEPIVGATVQYLPLRSNEYAEDYPNYDPNISGSVPDERYRTSQDGSFRVLAIPGAGVLTAIAQDEDRHTYFTLGTDRVPKHLLQRDDADHLNTYHPWTASGYHALREVHLPEEAGKPLEHDLHMTRGLTRRLKLVDEDGQPVEGARTLGRVFPSSYMESPLDGSTVEIVGLRPNDQRVVAFIHPERRIGKALVLSPGDEMTVALERCAVARGRVVDADAEPVQDVEVKVSISSDDVKDTWHRGLIGTSTDEDGRFEVLIPSGLTYRVWHYSRPTGPNFSATCQPKPGGVIELGDVSEGTDLELDDTAQMTTAEQTASSTHTPRQASVVAGETTSAQEAQKPLVYEGQVLTPDGKPAAGAKLHLVYWYSDTSSTAHHNPVAETGADGRFRFEMSRDDFHRTGDSVPPWHWASLVAIADGHGMAWAHSVAFEKTGAVLQEMSEPSHPASSGMDRLRKIIEEPQGRLRLADDVPIQGTLVDTEGQPIPGAWISLLEVYTGDDDTLDTWVEAAQQPRASFHTARNAVPKHLYGPHVRTAHKREPIAPVTTDEEGRFTIRGIGRERLVRLLVEAPYIEWSDIYCRTRAGETIEIFEMDAGAISDKMPIHGPQFTHVASPSKPVIGVVRDKATDKPIAGVTVQSNRTWASTVVENNVVVAKAGNDFSRTVTDEDGRYELQGLPRIEHNTVQALPLSDAAFLPKIVHRVNTQGSDVEPVELNVELMPGVVVTGRVTDVETGRGVSGQLDYLPSNDNPEVDSLRAMTPGRELARSDMKGNFRVVVPPGPGYLAFTAFGDTYEKKAVRPEGTSPTGSSATAFFYRAGDSGPEFHAIAKLDLTDGDDAQHLEMQVSRGRIVTGIIVDPEGQPLQGGSYVGRNERGNWLPIDGGKFAVATYDPDRPRRLTFVHRERKLAGTYVLSGEVDGEVRVQLQPWGTLKGRIVDNQENAVPNVLIASGSMARMMRPLSSPDARPDEPTVPLPPAESYASTRIITDEDGRFTIEGLVPGERYDLYGMEQAGFEQRLEGDIAEGVVLEPGHTVDLGDVTPERPNYEALRRAAEERAKEPTEANARNEKIDPKTDSPSDFRNRVSQLSSREPPGTKLVGHNSEPTEIEFTPDGERLVSGDRTGVLIVWDPRSGRPLQSMGHERWISALKVSPDGERIVSSGHDESVRVWDSGNGRQVFTLYGHGRLGGKYKVAIAPDGQTFASFGPDMYMRTWDMRTGKCLAEHAVRPQGMTIQEDEDGNVYTDRTPFGEGTMFVSMSSEFSAGADLLLVPQGGDIHIFDVQSGKELHRSAPGGTAFGQFALLPDGELLVTTFSQRGRPHQRNQSRTTDLRVVDFATDEVVLHRQLDGTYVRTIHFSPDGSLIGLNGAGNDSQREESTSVVRVETGEEIARVPGRAMEMAFSPDNGRLATSQDDRSIVVWDLAQFRTADD